LTVDCPDHPDDGLLRAFAAGTIGDDLVDHVAAHLRTCPACGTKVDGFVAGDTFVDQLRWAAQVSEATPSDAERAQVVRALRREFGRSLESARGGAGTTPPQAVGEYVILREVGRGGMGVVYQARHRGLRRTVAVKMILAGSFASEEHRARFHREAELAARVQHPNIVQIHEVGAHDGHPFLVMEWVDGGTLAARLGGEAWPAREAAALLETLTRAIDVAHRRGVVHRDLKPSNILLQADEDPTPGRPPARAIPKITDFGLARALDAEAGLTGSGLAVGTPEYMAPEQAAGRGAGPAADIYALGVVLYQLLTGQPPFRGDSPIEVLSALAHAEPVAPRRFRPRLPRDLETITLKAIEKEPARRYATAGEMADDIHRFLSDEPIRARPPFLWERVAKSVRRRPALAILTGALTSVTLLALVGITALWVDAARARDRATTADLEAASARDRANESAAEAFRRGQAERRARYAAGIAAAASALALDNFDSAASLLASVPQEHRNWEWRHFSAQLDNAQTHLGPADGSFAVLALAPAGDLLAYAPAGRRRVRVVETASMHELILLPEHDQTVTSIAFDARGGQLAEGSIDGKVRVWNLPSARPVSVLDGPRRDVPKLARNDVSALTFSSDGTRLLCVYGGARVRVWDIAGARCLSNFPGGTAQFTPDGRHVLAREAFAAHLRDAATGALSNDLNLPETGVYSVAMSSDGRIVATGAAYPKNEIYLWDTNRAGAPKVLAGHRNTIQWLTFNRDGRQLASYGQDRMVRIWDTATSRCVAVLPGHVREVRSGAFSADGRRLVSASWDRTGRIWDTLGGELLGILRCDARAIGEPIVSRDGSVVAMPNEKGVISVWDVDLAIRQGVLRGHTGYVYDVAFSPDDRTVASAAWDGTLRLWDANTGSEMALLRDPEPVVTTVAFSRDGGRIASIARHGWIRVWERASRRLMWSARMNVNVASRVECRIALSPDGALLTATGDAKGLVWIYETATGKPARQLAGHTVMTTDAAFSASGARLATADTQGTIRLWDASTGAPLAVARIHDQFIGRISFSPDGRTIASASQDATVRLVDALTLEERASWQYGGVLYGLAFSPDGTRLAVACNDSTVRLLDVATLTEVAELRGHGDYVHAVAFSPDGTRLVSGSGDQTVRIWDSLPPSQRDEGRAGRLER
jgi:WD40 repeat protein/serine/threonine protein kinase